MTVLSIRHAAVLLMPLVACGGSNETLPVQGNVSATQAFAATTPVAPTLVDTTAHVLKQGAAVDTAMNGPTELRIFDWPSHHGENNVYLGTTHVGRVTPGFAAGEWWPYRLLPGAGGMVRDSIPRTSKSEAMLALTGR